MGERAGQRDDLVFQRPKVKDAHRPVRLADGRIQLGRALYGVGAEISGEHAALAWHVLELMDGTRGGDEIVQAAGAEFPGVDGPPIAGIIAQLVAGGFVEDAAAPPPPTLSEAELERYSRGEYYYSWIDTDPRPSRYAAQARLKDSRVTVLGLGGTGSAAASSLVASGVGLVHCVDFDRVEPSNLNRQLLYTEDDVGHPKADRAVRRLRASNSMVQVTGAELRVGSVDDVVGLMAGCDLFMLCADQPVGLIEGWVNEAALRTRTPWVVGLYAGPVTKTMLYVPFETPCHLCLTRQLKIEEGGRWDGEPLERHRDLAEGHGVIAPTAAISGHLAALEALYFLVGLTSRPPGRMLLRNLLVQDQNWFTEPPLWPDCPACGRAENAY